jgi:hypothetical protein
VGNSSTCPKSVQGLESTGTLYQSKGYIDATFELDTTIDEKNGTIDVLIKVHEEKQYRVRMVETYGLDQETERLLKSRLEGQVFDGVGLWKFFDEYKPTLPKDVLLNKAFQLSRDVGSSSVDFTGDFRLCPKT